MFSPPTTMAVPYLLILLLLRLSATAVSIGVNYGTLADNLPPPAEVANFLKTRTTIDRVKIFDTNPDILRAFAGTGIAVTITAANGDIPSLAQLPFAMQWVATHIAPFHPQTRIAYIAVGNEILHWGDQSQISNLVPAMKMLYIALYQSGIKGIKVSTPHSGGILAASDPPSTGVFRRGWDRSILAPMLAFHRKTKSPFMVNPYPYFGYDPKRGNYALFKKNAGLLDKATGKTYYNMFDATLDAFYSAMKKLGYGDVDVVVTETGWPSEAEPGQLGVSVKDAAAYNGGLVRHVNSGKGTPLMPNRRFETYIFSLFNENLKPGPIAERNWGIFKPDFTPVYDIGIMRNGQSGGGSTPAPAAPGKKWCVAATGASDEALQKNINYVCSSGIDCKPIQSGGACFNPNTVRSHASFIMNTYYHTNGAHDFNCDFSKTGVLASANPSYGTCTYMS